MIIVPEIITAAPIRIAATKTACILSFKINFFRRGDTRFFFVFPELDFTGGKDSLWLILSQGLVPGTFLATPVLRAAALTALATASLTRGSKAAGRIFSGPSSLSLISPERA